MFSVPDGSFKTFENYTVKFSAKETKWTSLEVRTHPTFLETYISKYDFGAGKLSGLSRNEPAGASFSKLPVITGPVKLFCFPFQMGVSKLLKIIE